MRRFAIWLSLLWLVQSGPMLLHAAAPTITVQPARRTVVEASSYTFSVTAAGTAPLSYQWRRDGTSLTSKTNLSLALTSILTNDAGAYTVVISNVDGAITSAPAPLVVRLATDPVYPTPQGGWSYLLQGDSAAGESVNASLDGTWDHSTDFWVGDGRGAGEAPPGGVTSTNGILTIEDAVFSTSGLNRRIYLTHNLTNEPAVSNAGTLLNDGVTLTFRARLTPGTDPRIELTNAPNGLVNNSDGKGMFGFRQSGASGMLLGFSLNQATEDISATTSFNFGQAGLHMNNLNGDVRSSTVDPGEGGALNVLPLEPSAFHEFWITVQENGADPGTHRVSVYLDGSLTPTLFNVTAGTGFDGPAADYLALGMGSTAQRGAVDVDFFGYKAGALAPSAFNQPLGFSFQPTNAFVATGQLATFSVAVTGTPPYSFQWFRGGAAIGGATQASYTTGPVVASDEGAQFFVVVLNDSSSITSSPPAVLHLLSPPVLTGQPQSQTVTNGDTASFSVTVNSGTTPSYQWRLNGTNLSGRTNAVLVLPNAGPGNAGNYDVVVANASGSVTSAPAALVVVLFDFGDAPEPTFPTTRAGNGARHLLVPNIFLGASVDAEADGQPDANAQGDDTGADDEDGVSFPGPLRLGQLATLEVVASTNGFLQAWFDFDRNGSWGGAGEQLLTNRAVVPGSNLLAVTLPASAAPGSTYARFRFSTQSSLAFTGPAPDGEVEDYAVTLAPVAEVGVLLTDGPDPVASGSGLSYSILVSNGGPSSAGAPVVQDVLPAGVTFISALPSQGTCSHNAGVVTCTLGVLPSGATATISIAVTVGAVGTLTNSVAVSNPDFDPLPANNAATTTTLALNSPVITSQPGSLALTNGGTAVFSVTATGAAPLAYQWRRDSVELPGATNATLTLTNVQLAQAGEYTVQVTNAIGSVVSAPALLTVLVSPLLTVSPVSRTNLAGSTATFSANATGTAPLSYQWLFNGSPLAAATNTTLVFASVQSSNAGAYRVVVTNIAGAVTSVVANLTVIEMDFGDAPAIYPSLLSNNGARHRLVAGIFLGARVDFEPDAALDATATGDDLLGSDDEDGVSFTSPVRVGLPTTLTVVASTNGVLNAWLDFGRDGTWAEPGEQIFTNRNLTTGTNNLTFNVPSSASAGSTYARFRFATNAGASFTGEAASGEVEDYEVNIVTVADVAVTKLERIDPIAVGAQQIYTMTVTNAGPSLATGVSLTDTLPPGVTFISVEPTQGGCSQSAGVVVCSLGLMGPGNTAVVTVTVVPTVAGLLTNVVMVGANQLDLNLTNNSAQTVTTAIHPPAITSDPVSVSVPNGATVSFSVTASGTALRYQWQRDGQNVAGATNASLTLLNVQSSHQGSYAVRVTNEVGSVLSAPATLTVLSPIVITTQPQSQTVGVGSGATFTVAATGTAPLSYQWEYSGSLLVGQTASVLTLSNVQTNQAGSYRVRVNNSFESVTSALATLTVLLPPTFSPQPESRTNFAGTIATFVSAADGTQPIGLQWYYNATNRLAGQTAGTLSLTNVQVGQAGAYSLVASNVGGLATSAVAVLTVYEVDFGDAPESLGYPTTLAFNGARHAILPGLRLGTSADFETNAVTDALALGDDTTGVDDEDGVAFVTPLAIGGTATASVLASTNGFLDAWIDFNRNGTWADPEDRVLNSYPLNAGTNLVPLAVHSSALLGGTFARFRFSPAGGLSYDGFALGGEVEDYAVTLQAGVDLGVTITDSPDPVPVTSNVVYTVVVTNRGPAAATGVWLTNTLPASMTFLSSLPSQGSCSPSGGRLVCNFGTMANHGSALVTINARATAAGTLANTANVIANEGEIAAGDNSATQFTSVVTPAQSYVNTAAIPIADATAAAPGLGSPYPSTITVSGLTGAVYKVTATISNLSHGFASDVDILLVSPDGRSVMLLSDCGGNSVMTGLTLNFDDAASFPLPSGGTILPATYRPTNYEPGTDPFPPSAPAAPYGSALSVFAGINPNGVWSLYAIDDDPTDTGTVGSGWRLNIVTVDPIADLALTAVTPPSAVALGSNLVFTITVTNQGPAAASSVRFTNALPQGVTFVSAVPSQGACVPQGGIVSCDLGTIVPAGVANVAVTVTPTVMGALTNVASVGAGQLDFVPGNNSISLKTTVRPATDLLVAQASATNLVLLGQSLTCTLNVTNRGPNAASNVRLTNSLPPGVGSVSFSATQGACVNNAGLIICDLGGLAVNGHAHVTVTFTPSAVGSVTNVALVVSDEIDSLAGNNVASLTAAVTVIADIGVSLVDSPDPVAVGSTLTYAITVTNQGPLAASLVQVTNRLPSSVAFVNAIPSQGGCTQAGGIVSCSLGTVANAAQATIIVTVTPAAPGSLTNTVAASAFSLDPVATNNAASAISTALLPPAITAGPQGQTVTNGGTVVFSVTATGAPPLAYQWQFNDTNIASATNQSFTLNNVTALAAGPYRVRVVNAVGAVTSAVATLTVLSPPVISDILDQQTDEDTPTAGIPFIVTDIDSPLPGLNLTALSSNPTLVPATNVVFSGTTTNRTVQVTPAKDQSGTALITVRVTDPDGLVAVDTFNLTVRPVNDAPTLADVPEQSVIEDGVLIVPLLLNDIDHLAADLRVTAVSSNEFLTSTNLPITGIGTNRTLTLRPATNAFGTATISLTVTDTNGASATDTFVLTVTPVNDPPTLAALTNLVINEDGPVQTVPLLGLSAGPTNELQTLQVAASSDNSNLLATLSVNYVPGQSSGSLLFAPATNASGTATITVAVNDGGASNQLASAVFTVTVLPVNDAPRISDIGDVVTPEDTPIGPLAFQVSDIDTSETNFQFSVVSSDTNLIASSGVAFGGSGTNFTVTISPATNRFGTATVTITVSDGAGGSAADAFVVTVTPVNDPPLLVDVLDQLTEEELPLQVSAFVSDLETPAGQLQLTASLSDSNVIGSVSVASGAGPGLRVLSFTPRPEQSGATTVTLELSDGTNRVTDTFVVTVTGVNDAPTLEPIASLSVAEGSGPRVVNLSGISSGATNELQTLVVTASSANPAAIPIPQVAYTSANPTGTVTFVPAPGATGAVTLTVTVDDGGATNRRFSRDFVVTIVPSNRVPVVAGFGNRSTPEDVPAVFNLSISDRETAPGDLLVIVTSSDTNVVANTGFQLTGEENSTNRTLTVLPLPDRFGETLLTLTVSDADGGTNRQVALLRVEPVNDLPTLAALGSFSLPPGAGAQVVGLSNITSGAANETQSLTVTANSSDPALINPQINYSSPGSTGTLTFTPASGADASVVVTVTVRDDGATNNTLTRPFTVVLSTVNVPPTLAEIADHDTLEDTALDIPIFISDSNSPLASLSVTVLSSDTNLVANTNIAVLGTGASRTLHILPSSNQVGSATLTVTVKDSPGAFASDSFVLNVLPADERPFLQNPGPQTLPEDGMLGPISFSIGSSELPAAVLQVAVFSSDLQLLPASGLSLSGTGAVRTLTVTPAPNQFGSAGLTLTVTDTNGLLTEASFPVSVQPVNDPPTLGVVNDVQLSEDSAPREIVLTGIGAGAANELQAVSITASSSNPGLLRQPSVVYLPGQTTGTLSLVVVSNAVGSATVTVTASDGQSTNATATRQFTVTVLEANDPPAISSVANLSVPEDVAAVISLRVQDDTTPSGALQFFITASEPALFPSNGIALAGAGVDRTLTLQPATNRSGSATITIVVADTNNASTTNRFVLQVLPVNDPPTLAGLSDQTVLEDSGGVTLPFVVGDEETAADSLVVEGFSANPALVAETGILFAGAGSNRTVTLTPLAERSGSAAITVLTRDAGGLAASKVFVFTVLATNDPPLLSAVGPQAVDEDVPVTLALSASDKETAPELLSLTATCSDTNLVPNANIQVAIIGASRLLTITPGTNRSGSATMTLVLSDGTAAVSNSFVLTVAPVNDSPTMNALSNLALGEDAGLQTVNLAGIGPGAADEAGQAVSLVASSSNPSLSGAVGVNYSNPNPTGTLTFTPAANASGSAIITVTLDDGGASNAVTTRQFTVTINATNDPPSITDTSNQSMLEDGALNLAITVADLETAPYQLVLTAASTNTTLLPVTNIFFNGEGTNRLVTILPATNQFGTTLITLTVSDGITNTSDTFVLTVTAVNDPPTLNSLTDVTYSGNPSGQTISLSGISSGATNETEVLGVTVSSSVPSLIPTPTVSYSSPSQTGSISYNPANNGVGTTIISVTVTGANNTSITRAYTAYFRPAANTVPTITSVGNQTIPEDGTTGALSFTVGDSGTPVNLLTVAASSSNTNLVPNLSANLVLGGSGASRNITVIPRAHQSGTAAVTLSVTDTNFGWATNIFLVTVTALNDLPSISLIADQVILEDTPTPAIPFTVSDVETPAGSLAVSLASTNTVLVPTNNIVLGGSGTNRALVITPASNQAGTTLITLTVGDSNGGFTNRAFLLTVLATNDPPTLTGIPNQFVNEDTSTPALPFTISDAETAPGSLSVSVSSSNPGLVSSNGLALAGSGTDRTLTLTPEPEQSGAATVTLTVSDGVASSNISFVVAVQPVNDPPTLNALSNVVMNSGAAGLAIALNGITSGAANETQPLVVTATSSNPGILPHPTVTYTSPNVSGSLALNPMPGTNGIATVTVTVNDGGRGNSTTNRTFTVTVNGRPRLSELADQITDEDTLLVVPFTMADAETAAGALALTAFSSNTNLVAVTNILFTGPQGARTVSLRPNTNAFGHTTITVQVADADGLTALESFEWVVQPINDPPTLDPLTSRVLLEDAGLQLVTLTGITSGATNENDELSVSAFATEPGLLSSLQVDYLSSSPTGTLSFLPAPHAFGTTTVNVVVTDGQSLRGSVTQQWVLSIVASNDAPAIFGLTNATTLEDVPALVGFIVSDLETPGAALGIQATASNAQLLPPGAFQVVGSESSRALIITPAPNQSGLSDVTVTVTDGQGRTAAGTFVFSVTAVNDPPTLSSLADVTLNQDTPSAPLPLTVLDTDDPATSIQVVGASSNLELVPEGNVAVLGTGTNRQVIITPASGRTGTAVIQLTARDPAGATSTGRFRLTVQRVSQAPVIQTQPADLAVAVGGTANFGVTATGSGTLSYQWFRQGVPLPGRVASTLTLTGVRGSDAGSYRVEVRNAVGIVVSRDAVLQVNGEFRITGITRNAATTEIFFNTTSGRSYVVEYSTDLGSGTWQGLPAVAGTGGTVSVTDSAATGEQRFYRVREQ